MTLNSELAKLESNLSDCYTSCNNKGATIPQNQNFDNLSSCIDSITTGGGGYSGGAYSVKVIDYDGTLLKEDFINTGDTFTLPTPPSHTGFVFQEWSSPVAVTNNTVTMADADIIIGAVYTTASGKSEFDITLTDNTGLTVTLKMDGNKDWGDGVTDTNTSHTYAANGDYTIKCDGTTMTTTTTSGLFGQSRSYSITGTNANSRTTLAIVNQVPYLKRVRFATGITIIERMAFCNCFSLEYVTLPKGLLDIGNGNSRAFAASSIQAMVIPSTVTNISSRSFEACVGLKYIVIPTGCVIGGDYAFNSNHSLEYIYIQDMADGSFVGAFMDCPALKSIRLPNTTTATTLGATTYGGAFLFCENLKKIRVPNNITTISSDSFRYAYSCLEYDFTGFTQVPTLQANNVFTGINKAAVIKVPASLEATWKAAQTWSTYASYIVGV